MYKGLRDYIGELERRGELLRVAATVSPRFEIAEITDRMAKSEGGGKALLFENTGTEFPVLTNMMGSDERMALALGVERLDDIARRIADLLGEALTPKGSLMDKLRALPLLAEVSRWFPQQVSGRGACQHTVYRGEDVDLQRLPMLQSWECDGGAFVTLPMVHTVDPIRVCATWACTACSASMRARRACTGMCTRPGRAITTPTSVPGGACPWW